MNRCGRGGTNAKQARYLNAAISVCYAPLPAIRRAMPFQAPQSLTNEQVYAVTGYILHMNKLIEANTSVNASTLAAVKMPNRDGFFINDRPDSKAVACMTNCLKVPR
jgi:hypothetical protein